MNKEVKLFHWCREGNLLEVEKLHASGVDIHTNEDYAFRLACFNGHLDIVKYLVENGADVSSVKYFKGRRSVDILLKNLKRKKNLERLLK